MKTNNQPQPTWRDRELMEQFSWYGPHLAWLGYEIEGVVPAQAVLSRSDLSGANLSKANLRKANLIRANLSDANLFQANLSEAMLCLVNFRGCNLDGANLEFANAEGACFERAVIDGTEMDGTVLVEPSGIMCIGPLFYPTNQWQSGYASLCYLVDHGDQIMVRAGLWWGTLDEAVLKLNAEDTSTFRPEGTAARKSAVAATIALMKVAAQMLVVQRMDYVSNPPFWGR